METPPARLSDLTYKREREKMREAALDLLIAGALGRSMESLEARSGYHAQFLKAGAIGDPALTSRWTVFVQDTVKPLTVLGQLAPFTWPATPGAPIVDLGTNPAGDFVIEGGPIPVMLVPLTTVIAAVSKIAALVPFDRRTFEMAPRPAIEQALARSIAMAEDARLLDDEAAVPGRRPAGLRNSAPVFAGTTPADVAEAVAAAIASVRGGRAGHLVAISTASTAGYLGGLGMFPEAKTDGTGSISGLPLVIASAGPPVVIIADARAIAVVDGGLTMDAGGNASIDFTQPPGAPPSPLVSMWQTNAVAVKIVRYTWWWRPADATAVVDLGLTSGS